MIKKLSIALLCISLAGCATIPLPKETATTHLDYKTVVLTSPEESHVSLFVQVATTPQEQEDGLMYRDRMDEDKGMLFVFDREQPLTFWMKNTQIPLDVLFFDKDGNFVSSQSMVPCTADPCATYPSGKPATYALEANAGFLYKYGVEQGWTMSLR